MLTNFEETKEKQELYVKHDRKEISTQEFKDELVRLDDIIRKKLDDILDRECTQKFAAIKKVVYKTPPKKRYVVYNDIIALHRRAKEVCDEIKVFKLNFLKEGKKNKNGQN